MTAENLTTFDERMTRSIALLGKETMNEIKSLSVMVIGCGAVGGYALEMIARLGFGKIWAVDFDCFEASNINRQILATVESLGQKKCEAAVIRVKLINPEAVTVALDMKLDEENLGFILKEEPDFVIDAIDDVKAKAALIKFLVTHNIKFVSAQGAALKTRPELLSATTLDKTQSCALSKKMREMLRKDGVDLKKVRCVYSKEAVKICKDENGNNILGSLPIVPMVMGAMLANEVLAQVKA